MALHERIRMKALSFVLAILLAVLTCLVTGVAPAAAALRAVSFVSALTGWVAGDGAIWNTTDGGRTWHRQYTGRVQIYSLSFASASVGWAAGTDPIPGTGILFGTIDGGRTWSKLGEPRNPVRTMSFADGSHGFAVAGGSPLAGTSAGERVPAFFGGRLAATSDGGRSWRMLDNPLLVDTVCAARSPVAYAAYQAAVLRSEDGDTFANVFSPQIDTKLVWYATIHCAGDQNAWVQFTSKPLGDQRPVIVFRTTDGGRTWQAMLANKNTPSAYPQLQVSVADSPGPWPGPFAVVDADTAYFLGACPQCGSAGAISIVGTSTGGASWNAVATVPNITLTGPVAISFGDITHGWVVGSGLGGIPVVDATADGGLTWTQQRLP